MRIRNSRLDGGFFKAVSASPCSILRRASAPMTRFSERGASWRVWADVWKRHFFAWEYKGKHKDLVDAYNQLARYREDLENPPILVVCDMNRFEVHTNFTNSVKTKHVFDLDSLAEPKNLASLNSVFADRAKLEPKQTPNDITEQVAKVGFSEYRPKDEVAFKPLEAQPPANRVHLLALAIAFHYRMLLPRYLKLWQVPQPKPNRYHLPNDYIQGCLVFLPLA